MLSPTIPSQPARPPSPARAPRRPEARRARRTFVSEALLEADFGDIPREDLAKLLHGELHRLAAHEAALDLAIGRGLLRLTTEYSFRSLGHSDARDFTAERYGFSWSHGRELMVLAKALPSLPLVCEAFLCGALCRTKVREIVRVATHETEAGWLEIARRCSLRRLLEAIRRFKLGQLNPVERARLEDDGTTEHSEYERVSWSSTRKDAVVWNAWGLTMGRTVLGDDHAPAWKVAEAVAADTLARIGHGLDGAGGACTHAETTRRHRSRHRLPLDVKVVVEMGHRYRPPDDQRSRLVLPDPAAGSEAWEVHSTLLQLVSLRHGLDFERSRLLAWMDGRRLYRELGFSTADSYVQLGLGLAPRELAAACALTTQLACLPAISRAWRDGRMSAQVVALLARVADPRTDAAWARHAQRVTLKRLQLEVDHHLACQAVMTREQYLALTAGVPDATMPMRKLAFDWQEAFGCRALERERRSRRRSRRGACTPPAGARASRTDVDPIPELDDAPELLRHLRERVSVGFRAPAHVAALWREALHAQHAEGAWTLDDGGCVHAMLVAFAHAHVDRDAMKKLGARHAILERDNWQCSMPRCRSRRALEVHHRVFRSAGGDNDPANLLTLCHGCHDLIHGNRTLVVLGTAPDQLIVLIVPQSGGPARERWRNGVHEALHAA